MGSASLVRTLTEHYRHPILLLPCTLLFLTEAHCFCVSQMIYKPRLIQIHTSLYKFPHEPGGLESTNPRHLLDDKISETSLRRTVFLEAKSKEENGPIYLLFTVFRCPIERPAVPICHVNSILWAHNHWCRNGWCVRHPSGTRTPPNHHSRIPTPHRHHSLVI